MLLCRWLMFSRRSQRHWYVNVSLTKWFKSVHFMDNTGPDSHAEAEMVMGCLLVWELLRFCLFVVILLRWIWKCKSWDIWSMQFDGSSCSLWFSCNNDANSLAYHCRCHCLLPSFALFNFLSCVHVYGAGEEYRMGAEYGVGQGCYTSFKL